MMARVFVVSKLPLQLSLFEKDEVFFNICCSQSSLIDLHKVLRSVISNKFKKVPLNSFEEDVLLDLYNSISLINFKK